MKIDVNIAFLEKCISNNRVAQRKLYDMLLPYLNVICKRYLYNESDLKDVLQDAFINIFKNLHQFDLNRASFKTWITTIAINSCLKKNSKNSRSLTQELIIGVHEPEISPAAIENLSNEEIMTWLKKMPKQYFEVFNMYVIDGFSHPEIAQVLGIEESLSRQRLSRSRAWLKKRLPSDLQARFSFSFN